jgi:hypothetical protein
MLAAVNRPASARVNMFLLGRPAAVSSCSVRKMFSPEPRCRTSSRQRFRWWPSSGLGTRTGPKWDPIGPPIRLIGAVAIRRWTCKPTSIALARTTSVSGQRKSSLKAASSLSPWSESNSSCSDSGPVIAASKGIVARWPAMPASTLHRTAICSSDCPGRRRDRTKAGAPPSSVHPRAAEVALPLSASRRAFRIAVSESNTSARNLLSGHTGKWAAQFDQYSTLRRGARL